MIKKSSVTSKNALEMTYDWSGYTFLIVEDDIISYKLLEGILKKTKAMLIKAESGDKAVDLCKIRTDIDLVIMDLQLPQMNGYEATRRIKEIRPHLPVLVQTANAMDEEQMKAERAGCDKFISKPLNLKSFLNAIEYCIQKK